MTSRHQSLRLCPITFYPNNPNIPKQKDTEEHPNFFSNRISNYNRIHHQERSWGFDERLERHSFLPM